MANHTLHGCHMLFCNKLNENCQLNLALHPHVDLPDGSCTLVLEGDGGADGDVRYVAVEQDLDQSPEGPKANLANDKPRIINPLSKILQLSFLCLCIYVSGVDLKP
jgi:hypothetical protein